jgi:DNA-binding XRE family transcriptional regulator
LETPIYLLRKAIGAGQKEMALLVGAGYSTYQQYEAGLKLSPDVRAAAVEIARSRKLSDLAQLLSEYSVAADVHLSRYNPKGFAWHDMLEKVLETGDKRAKIAVQSALVLAAAFTEKESEK